MLIKNPHECRELVEGHGGGQVRSQLMERELLAGSFESDQSSRPRADLDVRDRQHIGLFDIRQGENMALQFKAGDIPEAKLNHWV